ncbi:MAG: hypothetical protein Tsb0020_53410 [Haliangiales bacterium]
MRSPFLITLLFAALGLGCSAADDFTGDLNRIGESIGVGSRPEPGDCNGNYTECLGTALQSATGSQRGHSRCQWCRDACRADGRWPSYVRSTRSSSLTCQWWQYAD